MVKLVLGVGAIVLSSSFSLFVGNEQKEEEEVQVREDLNRYKYLLEQKFILSGMQHLLIHSLPQDQNNRTTRYCDPSGRTGRARDLHR